MESLTTQASIISLPDVSGWIAAILAFLVSSLTLYNATRLKKGLLAVATYAFGAGMLSLSLGFLVVKASTGADQELVSLIYYLLFTLGFALLGFGSYQIYLTSKAK